MAETKHQKKSQLPTNKWSRQLSREETQMNNKFY